MLSLSVGQYFDPKLDDKTYLDNLQNKLELEVNSTRLKLIEQARLTEMVAKEFVAATLKENLFTALRVIAEKELNELNMGKKGIVVDKGDDSVAEIIDAKDVQLVHPRQDDGDEDSPTNSGLFPQVTGLIKAIFGQNQRKPNMTNYLDSAMSMASKPVSNQVVGLVNAIMGTSQTPPALKQPGAQAYPQAHPQGYPQQTDPQGYPQTYPQAQQGVNRPNLIPVGTKNNVDGSPVSAPLSQSQNNQQLLALLLSQTGGGTGKPFPPQNNPVHRPPPQGEFNHNQLQQLESFLEQYQASQLTPGGGGSQVVGGNNRPNNGGKGTSKPYIYNPSGAGGIGSSSAGFKPRPSINRPIGPEQNGGLGRPQFPGNQDPNLNQQGQQQQGGPEPEQTTLISVTTDEDEDEDEDEDGRRQLRQFGLGNLFSIFRPTQRPAPPITPGPVVPVQPNPSVSVTVDGQAVVVESAPAVATQPQAITPTMPEAFNAATFAQMVTKNFGDIVKVLPSLLMGARQGVQLIQTITQLFGGLDAIGDIAGGIL